MMIIREINKELRSVKRIKEQHNMLNLNVFRGNLSFNIRFKIHKI